jgi:hypothetical protein
MSRLVRAFPIPSVEALEQFGREIAAWPREKKSEFFARFGKATEDWYVQEIEGRPYVIAITEGEDLERGFEKMGAATDEFTAWFRRRVGEMSSVNLGAAPKGPPSKHVYSWSTESA